MEGAIEQIFTQSGMKGGLVQCGEAEEKWRDFMMNGTSVSGCQWWRQLVEEGSPGGCACRR